MDKQILDVAQQIENGRSLNSIMNHLKGEIEELQDEVDKTQRGDTAGTDGIMGEAIDVIICAVDLIQQENPDVTSNEIRDVASKKLAKWKRVYADASYDNTDA